jgi:hypothetical protein
MATHCTACGREQRDTDQFCSSCGMPVGQDARHAQPEEWKFCEITWSKKKGFFAKWYFWARNLQTSKPVVTGKKEFVPSGTTYGASQPEAGVPGTKAAFDDVVDQLTAAGWEPVAVSAPSTSWWSRQFRHRVSHPRLKPGA